jgi:excisionase family DNA binding protein
VPTNTTTPTGEWISPRQIANELDISYPGACLLIRRGDIPGVKVGRSLRVRRSDFDDYLDRRRTTPAQRRELLGEETVAFLSELAEHAPALTEAQKDTIRAAFRAPPKMPRPVPRPKRGRNAS